MAMFLWRVLGVTLCIAAAIRIRELPFSNDVQRWVVSGIPVMIVFFVGYGAQMLLKRVLRQRAARLAVKVVA